MQEAFTDYGASIGDYLLVGPVLLQLLPLVRHCKGRQRALQAPICGGHAWDIFKTDGLPKKVGDRSGHYKDELGITTLSPSACFCLVVLRVRTSAGLGSFLR